MEKRVFSKWAMILHMLVISGAYIGGLYSYNLFMDLPEIEEADKNNITIEIFTFEIASGACACACVCWVNVCFCFLALVLNFRNTTFQGRGRAKAHLLFYFSIDI